MSKPQSPKDVLCASPPSISKRPHEAAIRSERPSMTVRRNLFARVTLTYYRLSHGTAIVKGGNSSARLKAGTAALACPVIYRTLHNFLPSRAAGSRQARGQKC